ncbi:MAG: hypothetical protein M3T56_09330, partial [Chloroflexota bacterium]|nr:hypothetical protein [Chloroflexota bacterium]
RGREAQWTSAGRFNPVVHCDGFDVATRSAAQGVTGPSRAGEPMRQVSSVTMDHQPGIAICSD